jgi:cell wall-associated NlpC family hydrolase
MKRKSLVLLAILVLLGLTAPANAVKEQDESFGQKVKNLFATPTPPPKKKKHSKSSPSPSPKHKTTSKTSPSPKPKSTPTPTPSPSPTAKEEATAKPSETPSPVETPSVTPRSRKIRGEAVHAISPGPHQKHAKAPPEGVSIPKVSATPTEPAIDEKSPRPKADKTPATENSPEIQANKETLRTSSISGDRIARYDDNDAPVRKVLENALGLTTRNLTYKYGSADPASGGMDCSGFVYYVLKESGLKDVPRDAREQYIWLRKAGTFQAVLGHSEDTFELEALKPGDLLFWAGTYRTEKDPAITHTMIYLGREKGTNQRIMVGSSDGRTYKGQSRFGVSVFDFHVATHKRAKTDSDEQTTTPVFVGYGRVPDLEDAR